MSQDLLELALGAYEEEHPTDHGPASFTRRRVLATVRERQRKRRRRLLTLVPLAAILAGTTALAGPAAREALASRVEPTPQVAQEGTVAMVARAVVPASFAVEPRAVEPNAIKPSAVESSAIEPNAVTEPVADEPAVDEPAPTTVAAAAKPELDPTLALYQKAHAAHFGGGSPTQALQLWNSYLAAAPGGHLAPEAMFNRAICLVRLGRHDAARTALAPFAAGQLGSYRKAEAESLLTALGR